MVRAKPKHIGWFGCTDTDGKNMAGTEMDGRAEGAIVTEGSVPIQIISDSDRLMGIEQDAMTCLGLIRVRIARRSCRTQGGT